MKKRAQVTIFIILALGLLLSASVYFIIKNKADKLNLEGESLDSSDISSEFLPFKAYFEECIKDVSDEGLLTLSLQGGYYTVPELNFDSEFSKVPYYFYEGAVTFPSLETFESEFSKYIDLNLRDCLGDFSALLQTGINVESMGTINTISKIGLEDIFIAVYTPINISRGETKAKLRGIPYKEKARVREIYGAVNEILVATIQDPYHIDVTNLFNLQDKYGFQIDTLTHGTDTIIYVIQDEKTIIKQVPMTFLFAVKVPRENVLPEILTGNIQAKVGEKLEIYIEAEDLDDNSLSYYADKLLLVDPVTGYAEFMPEQRDVGEHEVKLTVFDDTDFVEKNILLEVIS